uniref:sphingosine-1-phosphate transporter MFSD2B isoform X3 n=1 Tax=Nyctereutes procyonoides TaxID=34880 RepID=UPI002443A83F|nr:sphingosine-1-phosphate transporter MFSD2B isoform X3 [Nyctereutes procyonoides]
MLVEAQEGAGNCCVSVQVGGLAPVSPPQDSRAGQLSFCTKVCYGIGGMPNQVASSATAFYLQLFLLDVAQIPAAQVSLVLFGGKVSGAAADPVAGFFINRSSRTGSGRLMPWVLGCAPFLAVAYFLLWFLPPFSSLRGLWYTAFYCLFQALATSQQVPYAALTMRLTPCPRERDSATAYRMTMEMAGTLMGAAVHGLLVSGAHRPHPCEDAAPPGPLAVSADATRLYSIAAAVVAMMYPVCSGLLCLGVKERADSSAPASGQGLSFLAGLGLTVRHPPYLKLVISFLFISAAIQVEQSYLVLFCTHASRLHDHVQGVVLTILVSAVLSTPLWEWVLQRFGKKTSAFGICSPAKAQARGLLVKTGPCFQMWWMTSSCSTSTAQAWRPSSTPPMSSSPSFPAQVPWASPRSAWSLQGTRQEPASRRNRWW